MKSRLIGFLLYLLPIPAVGETLPTPNVPPDAAFNAALQGEFTSWAAKNVKNGKAQVNNGQMEVVVVDRDEKLSDAVATVPAPQAPPPPPAHIPRPAPPPQPPAGNGPAPAPTLPFSGPATAAANAAGGSNNPGRFMDQATIPSPVSAAPAAH